jgi:GNAT superfamily N-acetyltransferase
MRSKAVWGYDAVFMEACRSELTINPVDLQASRIQVAETASRKIVGVVQVKSTDTDADLAKLFVEPGRLRAGTGRLLFEWAIRSARELGAIRLTIEAEPEAAGFYEKMGAQLVGTAPSGSIPGRTIPKLVLVLK